MFRLIKRGTEPEFLGFKLEDVEFTAERKNVTGVGHMYFSEAYLITEVEEAIAFGSLLDSWYWNELDFYSTDYVVYLPSVGTFEYYNKPIICKKDNVELLNYIETGVTGF